MRPFKGSKSTSSGKSSGSTSPAPVTSTVVAEPPLLLAPDESTSSSVTATQPPATTDICTGVTEPIVNGGKFTTSNFVESVVTPTGSVFGESGKSSKKRKTKDDISVQLTNSVINPNNTVASEDSKRLKIDLTSSLTKTESLTPSVVVKAPLTTPLASPTVTPSLPRPPPTSKFFYIRFCSLFFVSVSH